MTITPYRGKRGTSWRVRVELAPDPVTGERRWVSETIRGTRKEAKDRETLIKARSQEGLVAPPDRMTLSELTYQWIEDILAPNVRPATLYGYKRTLEVHILPTLGGERVQRLTAARLQAFYSARRRAGVSDTMLDRCHRRLRQLFRQALRWGIVTRSPMDGVTPPRVRREERRVWSQTELLTFLDTAQDHPSYPLWVLILTTGLRKGEALGLRWRDVDLEAGTLHVRQVVSMIGTTAAIQEPKTPAARRVVRLDPETVAVLRDRRQAWLAARLKATTWEPNDLIFCTRTGHWLHPNNQTTVFRRLIAKAEVPPITIHDLRHTNVSHLLSAGLPLTVVSNRLGHRDPSTTARVYAHLLAGDQDAAVAVTSRLLKPLLASDEEASKGA